MAPNRGQTGSGAVCLLSASQEGQPYWVFSKRLYLGCRAFREVIPEKDLWPGTWCWREAKWRGLVRGDVLRFIARGKGEGRILGRCWEGKETHSEVWAATLKGGKKWSTTRAPCRRETQFRPQRQHCMYAHILPDAFKSAVSILHENIVGKENKSLF